MRLTRQKTSQGITKTWVRYAAKQTQQILSRRSYPSVWSDRHLLQVARECHTCWVCYKVNINKDIAVKSIQKLVITKSCLPILKRKHTKRIHAHNKCTTKIATTKKSTWTSFMRKPYIDSMPLWYDTTERNMDYRQTSSNHCECWRIRGWTLCQHR